MKLRNKKTGEIKDIQTIIHEAFTVHGVEILKNLEANWEDYEPKEPLIKDEKIRKAVRAWADANGAWPLVVVSGYRIEISQVDAEILFNDPVFEDLPRDRQLTIEELCGEEENEPIQEEAKDWVQSRCGTV